MTSISEKLRNNIDKDMKLGGLQDIGGIRYVFADIKTLNEFDNKLQAHTFNGFEFKKRYSRCKIALIYTLPRTRAYVE
jgi:hypothetical protein